MNRLQERRMVLGLTQPQVSARLKETEPRADVGMVSRYEKGVCLPTPDQLKALELIPSADRRTITVQSTAKCSLTPTDPVTTSLYITNAPSTGELMVAEMVPQVPGQLALDGEEQDHPKILKFKRQA